MTFRPRWPWRNRHVQSILPSLLPRWGLLAFSRPVRKASREWIIDCRDGVRLQAFHACPPQPNGQLAVLLHGWEGSADARYVLTLAQLLFERGVEVIRLNLRDHGDTHHLNEDIFHSCRLPEVIDAVAAVSQRRPQHRRWLIGFSLGGNFMLRVAASGDARVAGLAGVIAVSPVLDPDHTLTAMEHGMPVYQKYFVRKWISSLRRKQAAWRGRHDFSHMLHWRDLRRMTAALVARHTDFPSMEAYLRGYAIVGERLATLTAPATILTAEDDPIIPVADLVRLARSDNLSIVTTPQGGHMGFIESPWKRSWVNGWILEKMGLGDAAVS
ncbi:MAG: alpha/beta fold hydrolase [Nevskiaceae bacterium]|jgi:predicted alpha/beta-fold hydrolase|nr:alpha/beta fold hydrolase [Nevskiaceae bacterium]